MFLKHCFMQQIDANIRLSLIVFKVNGVLSRFYLLFNFDLVIMAFLNVLFMKGLLLYLIYFCFSGASFSRAELKVVLKHLRKSFVLEKIFIRISSKSHNSDKRIFYFYRWQKSFWKYTLSFYGDQMFPSLQSKIS